jgi:exodeoxyribonuclease VII small subunit
MSKKTAEKAPKDNDMSDIEAMSFETALAELETIVSRLEKGDVPLEQSISLYERGEALKKHCDKLLKAAEYRVDVIQKDEKGQVSGTQPLDTDEA